MLSSLTTLTTSVFLELLTLLHLMCIITQITPMTPTLQGRNFLDSRTISWIMLSMTCLTPSHCTVTCFMLIGHFATCTPSSLAFISEVITHSLTSLTHICGEHLTSFDIMSTLAHCAARCWTMTQEMLTRGSTMTTDIILQSRTFRSIVMYLTVLAEMLSRSETFVSQMSIFAAIFTMPTILITV